MTEKRVAWAITGAGYALQDCVEVLESCPKADVFLSRAAEEVLQMYHLDTRVQAPSIRVYREVRASSPIISGFITGVYRLLVVAPATSNSVAKFVHGISDTLVSNLFAHAGKSRVPVIVYPTDLLPEEDSSGPQGESITVFPRPIDLENAAKLRSFPGVTVVSSREELERSLSALLE